MHHTYKATSLAIECSDRHLGIGGRQPDARPIAEIAVDVRREWGLPADAPLARFTVDGREATADEWRAARLASCNAA